MDFGEILKLWDAKTGAAALAEAGRGDGKDGPKERRLTKKELDALPVDARLDLHGLTAAEAEDAGVLLRGGGARRLSQADDSPRQGPAFGVGARVGGRRTPLAGTQALGRQIRPPGLGQWRDWSYLGSIEGTGGLALAIDDAPSG